MWLISRSSTNGYAHSTHLFGTGYLQVTFVRKIQTVCEGESKQCFFKRWFFRVETRLWNHCSSCGICGGEVASGQVSLRVRGFFEALVFQSGGPSLKPLQLMWDLWWAKWHQAGFSERTWVFWSVGFSEWRPVFETTAAHVGFVVGEVASGQVSLRVRGFFEELVFQSGGPSLKPLQLMWDLWWAKWHQGRFLWEYVGFPLLTTILPVFYINLSTVWGLENRAVTRGSSTETKTYPTTEININRESGRSFNLVCFT